ncbi:hypothetical protein QBC47DRAFT_387963 [Echria macrotheca]|uniref:Uncharacterized protein n=1 Tax=Echria macrotheca TaxID=438768 RepID=A0AAJ0BA08_9PEZI|nr:hypothetical protein QBC47DRAFT_387963 [Echria macrotheca]
MPRLSLTTHPPTIHTITTTNTTTSDKTMSHFNNMNTNEQGLRRGANMNLPGQTYGESPASGPAPTTAGHHSHDILNKLDPRVDSTQDRRPMPQNAPAGTYGPHTSRLANILDPRVDSSNPAHQPQPGMVPGNNNIPEGTYGLHRSRVGNAMDPRVDSDMDRTGHQPGAYGATGGTGYQTAASDYGAGPTGMTSTNPGHGYRTQETMPGGMGTTTGGTNHTHNGRGGVGMMSGGATGAAGMGPHNNAMGMNSGPGPAPNTAGPHRSDLLNKLDPRVDSKTGVMKTTERRGI